MQFNGLFYVIVLAIIFCLVYLVLFSFIPTFFGQAKAKLTKRSLISIIAIGLLSLLAYYISYLIPDLQLGNRFLHTFGGGFLAFLTCFLVARDVGVRLTKFQFFAFSFLVATALGVGNELLEFALQSLTGQMFTDSLTDTWLDLTSNTVGALIASACLLPCFKEKEN